MKKQKSKLIIIIITSLILIIFLFQVRKNASNRFQDDLIFFKLFSSGKEENKIKLLSGDKIEQSYNFQVSYKNIDLKNINLSDTINKNSLIREKIAPGTKGEFEILLHSNKKMNYRIQFKSTNEKPKNLYFQIKGNDIKYQRLEDMETKLKGEIKENKSIVIQWKWDYEKDEIENIQDTKDGEKIKRYNFTIYTTGE